MIDGGGLIERVVELGGERESEKQQNSGKNRLHFTWVRYGMPPTFCSLRRDDRTIILRPIVSDKTVSIFSCNLWWIQSKCDAMQDGAGNVDRERQACICVWKERNRGNQTISSRRAAWIWKGLIVVENSMVIVMVVVANACVLFETTGEWGMCRRSPLFNRACKDIFYGPCWSMMTGGEKAIDYHILLISPMSHHLKNYGWLKSNSTKHPLLWGLIQK